MPRVENGDARRRGRRRWHQNRSEIHLPAAHPVASRSSKMSPTLPMASVTRSLRAQTLAHVAPGATAGMRAVATARVLGAAVSGAGGVGDAGVMSPPRLANLFDTSTQFLKTAARPSCGSGGAVGGSAGAGAGLRTAGGGPSGFVQLTRCQSVSTGALSVVTQADHAQFVVPIYHSYRPWVKPRP